MYRQEVLRVYLQLSRIDPRSYVRVFTYSSYAYYTIPLSYLDRNAPLPHPMRLLSSLRTRTRFGTESHAISINFGYAAIRSPGEFRITERHTIYSGDKEMPVRSRLGVIQMEAMVQLGEEILGAGRIKCITEEPLNPLGIKPDFEFVYLADNGEEVAVMPVEFKRFGALKKAGFVYVGDMMEVGPAGLKMISQITGYARFRQSQYGLLIDGRNALIVNYGEALDYDQPRLTWFEDNGWISIASAGVMMKSCEVRGFARLEDGEVEPLTLTELFTGVPDMFPGRRFVRVD